MPPVSNSFIGRCLSGQYCYLRQRTKASIYPSNANHTNIALMLGCRRFGAHSRSSKAARDVFTLGCGSRTFMGWWFLPLPCIQFSNSHPSYLCRYLNRVALPRREQNSIIFVNRRVSSKQKAEPIWVRLFCRSVLNQLLMSYIRRRFLRRNYRRSARS